MLDQLSPVAPARVRVLLLPIGQIKRARFLSFVERLQPEHVVRLGDISPDGRPNRNMFSPLAFPTGLIVFDLTTFCPPPAHVALSPFELYREPLVILAIADSTELEHVSYQRDSAADTNGFSQNRREENLRALHEDLKDVRENYPKALVHQLLLFDYPTNKDAGALPEGFVGIPSVADSKRTTMKTVICDVSSVLLAEMTTLAKSLQALSTIESPGSSSTQRQTPWSPEINGSGRRKSQFSLPGHDSRSESPAGSLDRSQVRMSMPAHIRPGTQRTESAGSISTARPSTPQNGLSASFDPVGVSRDSASPDRNAHSRSGSVDARNVSRDRVSVQGFGSGSVSERSRTKGKGRVSVVIGSLYQCAGRWSDSLRESVDSAVSASKSFDHLWHAKALDNILVSMLMLAWNGLDFQIPQVCYASGDKSVSASASEPRSPASNRLVSLQNLVVLLPELLDRILNLYNRAANIAGEALPQYPYSETTLRFSKLMCAIHLAGGSINDDVLQLLVLGTPFQNPPDLLQPRLNIHPSRSDIASLLSRAFPHPATSEALPVIDRTIILSGIASVLGIIGYQRKKAMVMRDLVSVLIPGLIQARKLGAAELGVHPAAGLAGVALTNRSTHGAAALNLGEGDVENGIDTFLELLNRTYGVLSSDALSGAVDDSDDATASRIVRHANLRKFGGASLKMDVLRSCIKICEALPDFHGVLKFTADLLRTAGSGIAPGPRSDDASPSMSREEQVMLASNISRTVNAASKLGLKDFEAEYWDEFLVRGVELEPAPASRTPIPHRKAELPGSARTTSTAVNPFIYNPFSRPPDASAVDRLMVAGENAVFKITLQNPYEFDVDIESITLESDGAEFTSYEQRTVIGPYRTQIMTVAGLPKESGELKITGCIIKIRGCRKRRFPIFCDPWSPQTEVKIKATGLALVQESAPTRTGGWISSMRAPKPTILGLNVIKKQPVVTVKSCTLSQSAVMMLEGERRRFSITLQNMSRDAPADLVLFSFNDSTQAALEAAMSSRDASPAELYEYEVIFARKQVLRWIRNNDEKPFIVPGGTATFEMEILGKPGLTSASIQIDYACLGDSEVQEQFHTRQVTLPLTVTVNASIELVRMDVLPLTGTIPGSLWSAVAVKDATKDDLTPETYCLIMLDLLNKWPTDLQVRVKVDNGGVVEEDILPGNMSRIILPMRRIFLEDPSAPIPALDPARQRQFVVSTGRVTAETERISRETFWYREEMLKVLSATWSIKSSPSRIGEIELRGMRPTPRVIEAIKVDDIEISLILGSNSNVPGIVQKVFTDHFTSLKVQVTNHSKKPVLPLLRLQPSLRNQQHNASLELAKKFICNGVLQQTLSLLPAHKSTEVIIGITPLCRGEFEINASVEEGKLFEAKEEKPIIDNKPTANIKTVMDSFVNINERRIWHCREPCIVVVEDDDSDSGED